MSTLEERRRRGEEILKRYRARTGYDSYACAADAIGDILLGVAQSEEDAAQVLQSAEMDFRSAFAGESFFTEG